MDGKASMGAQRGDSGTRAGGLDDVAPREETRASEKRAAMENSEERGTRTEMGIWRAIEEREGRRAHGRTWHGERHARAHTST
jgi:hypothetical protein